MTSRLRSLCSLLLCLLTGLSAQALWSQESPIPALPLRIQSTIAISNEPAGPLILRVPVRCDSSGNIYVRGYRSPDLGAAPVVRISAQGKKEAVFSLGSAPGFGEGDANDFAVGLRGEVYLLAAKKDSLANVVVYDKEGHYKATVPLEGSFAPYQLAVSAGGDFLVSGNRLQKEQRRLTYEPFTGIFDRNGRLMQEILLPGDVEPDEVKSKGEAAAAKRLENPGLELGIVETGEDGNFYLMRAAANPVSYVISPSGELLRRFVVDAPGRGYRPVAMKPVVGRLLVVFEEMEPQAPQEARTQRMYSLVDTWTGEKLNNYVSPREGDGIFACYSSRGFTFLGTTANLKMVLRRATP